MRLLIGAIILTVGFTSPVLADGIAIAYFPDALGTGLVDEEKQNALISYENGIQDMTLVVGLNSEVEEMVWLFPVPCVPDDVEIDITNAYPWAHGMDVTEAARDVHGGVTAGLLLVPVISVPGAGSAFINAIESEDLRDLYQFFPHGAAQYFTEEVEIHKSIEEYGLTSQLITADSLEPLEIYLNDLGMSLPAQAKDALEDYIRNDYSFVVSFRSPDEENTMPGGYDYMNLVGVRVRFPTDRIYFPLKPTSVYGERKIPVNLIITGYNTPVIPHYLEAYTDVKHIYPTGHGKGYDVGDEDYSFFLKQKKFTEIYIDAPSSLFKDDLWISTKGPVSAHISHAFLRWCPWFMILTGFVITILSGLIAGRYAMPERNGFWHKLGHVISALAVTLTIVGVVVVFLIVWLRHDNKGESLKRFIVAFVASYYVLTLLTILILNLLI